MDFHPARTTTIALKPSCEMNRLAVGLPCINPEAERKLPQMKKIEKLLPVTTVLAIASLSALLLGNSSLGQIAGSSDWFGDRHHSGGGSWDRNWERCMGTNKFSPLGRLDYET